MTESWTAILLAGQRPGPDPLASHFGEHYKALIPVHDVPMVDRVAECLLSIPSIRQVIILGQEPEKLVCPALANNAGGERLIGMPSQAGIAESIEATLKTGKCPWPVLVTTADHALLTPVIVEQFLAAATHGDVCVAAVERAIVMRDYPETRRTWLTFSDGAYSGANLFALRSDRVYPALSLWSRAERDRKQAFKLFWHFGPLLAIRAMLRLISFGDALRLAGLRLGVDARLVLLDHPEAAIDVDKPSDHFLVERIIAARAGSMSDPARPSCASELSHAKTVAADR